MTILDDEVTEPPTVLLHVALEKDWHHREWCVAVLGSNGSYTAIDEVDREPTVHTPLTLGEAIDWTEEFATRIARARGQGWTPARLWHSRWSGLPPESGLPPPIEPGPDDPSAS